MRVARVVLEGHLTRPKLEAVLGAIARDFPGESEIGLLVDCMSMTSYDSDARSYFVDWHKKMAARIPRTAIVHDNALWTLVVATMRLAAGVDMRSFSSQPEAATWLETRRA